MPVATTEAQSDKLLPRITCPHCWEQFSPEKILWVSEHIDLLGDPKLGFEHQQRFLPTRFTVGGEALDSHGFPCHQLACPNCHLSIPRPVLEMEQVFLSIFGAPASGKSYFLAAMTWELRKILPLKFSISFSDAEPALNQKLNQYEESLFSSDRVGELVSLAALIEKTQVSQDAGLYDTVSFGSQTVSYPRPFLFSMQPQPGHPNGSKQGRLGRVVCLYDNAGESFQPGSDSAAAPVTRHMAHSRALFFVFDPMQDNNFRARCSDPKGTASAPFTARQEPVLQEAAARIRRYAGLRQTEKHDRPLIVIVTKCDAWLHLIGDEAPPEPWRVLSRDRDDGRAQDLMHALDTDLIERRSKLTRKMLLKYSPEIVTAAEGFAQEVVYIPVSSVGWGARVDEHNGLLSIRPGDTKPYWVTVPFLYALSRWSKGLIPAIKRKPS